MTAISNGDSAPKVSLWNDPKARSLIIQTVTIILVFSFIGWIAHNTATNLEKQGIASGFGFLDTTAGFAINQTLIEYSEESSYGRAFWVGLLNTLLVAGLGIFFATIIGFIMGVARLSNNWLISKIAAVYIEVFRNIPLLVQMLFWYSGVLATLPSPKNSMEIVTGSVFLNNRGFFVPTPLPEAGFSLVYWALLIGVVGTIFVGRWAHKRQEATGQQFPIFYTGLGLIVGLPVLTFLAIGMPIGFEYPELGRFNLRGGTVLIPELVAATLSLSIYTGSFIAENVRAGIMAVSHGQTEAAHALGLRNGPTLRLVVIPQAMRVIIPPLTSQYLNLTKNSSLGMAIAYQELVAVFAGIVLNQTGQAVEVLLITMLVYLGISLTISMFMNWYNSVMALKER